MKKSSLKLIHITVLYINEKRVKIFTNKNFEIIFGLINRYDII